MAVAAVPGCAAPVLEAPDPPSHIREALPEDREQAWSLQRSAFSLPDDSPPSHPGFDADLRVYSQQGKVVSCLTLIHAHLAVRGVSLPMGGLRHVATDPEEQNQGYASALIRDTLLRMRQRGLLVSVLFPFSFRYYRKFGYELGGNFCHFWSRPNSIPSYREREGCRKADGSVVDGLASLYSRRTERSTCAMARDRSRWSQVCSDPRYTTIVFGDGTPDGYAVVEETKDSYGGRVLKVLDLVAETPTAWRGLVGYLSQAPVESVEWLACARDLTSSGLLRSTAPLREGFKPRGIATVRPMFQFRVTDLAGTLQALAHTFPRGKYRLALKVRDDLLPENAAPVLIHGLGDRVEIKTPRPSDPVLEADIRIMSQMVCGYMSPIEAVSQELARCPSIDVLSVAEELFPAGHPFISELDRF